MRRPGYHTSQRPPPPPRRSKVWRLVALLPSFLVLALLAWAGLFLLMAPRLPDTDQLFADSQQRQVTLLAADGTVLDERGTA